MVLLPPLTLFTTVLHLVVSGERVDIVYGNHRYFDPSASPPQTPRTFQKPLLTHLTQKNQIQQPIQRKILQNPRPKNNSTMPLKLAMVKRSGDYHFMNMEYPQYDMDDHGHPMYGHHTPAVRTVLYSKYPMYEKHSPKFDVSSLGIVALLKLILLKIISFGLFKLILLFLIKFPLIIFTLGFKFLIILKLIKLVKLLTVPIIIPFILILIAPILIVLFILVLPLLLPLILAPVIPFILIPILLPLLLSLPVPVLAPTTTGRRRRQAPDPESRSVQDDVLYLVRRVLESEQCIERVACQLAADKQSKGYASFVAWYLDKAAGFIKQPRFTSYKEAYKRGTKPGLTPQHCTRLYACNNPRQAL